jgi:hypothetical protein
MGNGSQDLHGNFWAEIDSIKISIDTIRMDVFPVKALARIFDESLLTTNYTLTLQTCAGQKSGWTRRDRCEMLKPSTIPFPAC